MPVRYEELPGPLEGWTYDEEGVVHTPSGYRCTAQQIEGMLWLFGCLPFNPEKLLIHSDETAGALRPLYERAHIDTTNSDATPATRSRTASQR
jgi:hypothetical protein